MLARFRALAEEIRLPILIYNVVPWSYLSPQLLYRIMGEVPLVIGVKQSNGDLKLLADLLVMAPAAKRIITAVDPLLYPAFALGAHGAIGAMPTAAPGPCVALWNAVERGDYASAKELHESLLGLWGALAGDNLPATVKQALALQGCDAGFPRAPMPPASAVQRQRIEDALLRLKRNVVRAAAD